QSLRPLGGGLLVVGRAGVAALGVLEVANVVALLHHQRGHLAGMSGVDPVVPGGGRQQCRRVIPVRENKVVGRVAAQVGPVLRNVGISVLRHPGSTGQQQVVSAHVQQWYGGGDSAERL